MVNCDILIIGAGAAGIAAAKAAGISPDQTKTGDQLAKMAGVEVFTAVLTAVKKQA